MGSGGGGAFSSSCQVIAGVYFFVSVITAVEAGVGSGQEGIYGTDGDCMVICACPINI